MKRPYLLLLMPWLVIGLINQTRANAPTNQPQDLKALSTSQLEEHLAEIDAHLVNLASYSLRGGIGAIGYRSFWQNSTQWIEIEFDRSYPIDQIVLIPYLSRHPTKGFQTDAFPGSLRILSGVGTKDEGTLIAELENLDSTLPGIRPLIIPISRSEASWIRIEATDLTKRIFDGSRVLQLAEIMVFSDAENVALKRPVRCSSSDRRSMTGAWNERFLVDGFTPYLMDSAKGTGSKAFIGTNTDASSITIDLGSSMPLSRIHLHAVEQSDTVPQAYYGDLGIPNHMRIEGSNTPDFLNTVELLDYRTKGITETGPIIMMPIPETECRYVRIVPLQGEAPPQQPGIERRIGFAEIEIFSKGQNIALGKPVTSKGFNYGQRDLSALTDGSNLYGKIISIREWMNELSTRGRLESERPKVIAELDLRYDRQKNLLTRLVQLVVLLLVVIGFTILIDRHFRLRKVSQVRERIAADLHDELGANIHTIGLISDMAKNAMNSPKELKELLDEIRIYTEKSGDAARYCTNILEARGICEDLVDEMKQFSNRILADLEHDFSVEGEEILKTLEPHKRIDLLLFYKECLTNILRHSNATKVKTHLIANNKSLSMKVSDNGVGLEASNAGNAPHSLNRRAKLLRARIISEQSVTGGTRITLKMKTKKFSLFK